MAVPATTRRHLLAAVGAGVLLPLSGCALEPPRPSIGPLDCPDRPEQVNPSTLRTWLPAVERASMHNDLLREVGPREVNESDFEVTAVTVDVGEPVIESASDGILAYFDQVVGDLTFEHESGRGSLHVETVVSYFVSESLFLRAPAEGRIDPRSVPWGKRPSCAR